MARVASTAFALALLVTAGSASAAPRLRVVDAPCKGCVSSWSTGTDPAPLLVLLHGDWGNDASALQLAWEPLVAAQGITLLSLACPRDQGCQGSFWKWNGPPTWIDAQIDALAQQRSIDRTRMWIAGWSGGATYIGFRAQELERRFSAFVIHGGGSPPASSTCSGNTVGAYFLVGSSNPYHGLQIGLRDYFVACKQETEWNVLSGSDHDAEWKALAPRGPAIVRWLLGHSRGALAAPVDAGVEAPAIAAVDAASPAPSAASLASSPPSALPPASHSGCGCSVATDASVSGVGAAFAAVALAGLTRRRARSRSARR